MSLLTGTVIGAGIFSLPFIFRNLGFLTGLVYLFVFAFIYYLTHKRYAEVLISDKEGHHFIYFTKKLLGKWWNSISFLVVLGGLVLAMTVYLTLAPEFISLITAGDRMTFVLLFWAVGSVAVFFNAKWLGLSEMAGILGIVVITLVIFAFSFNTSLNVSYFSSQIQWSDFILPFGPLLFAFAGRSAVPKMVDFYHKTKKENRFSLKTAALLGTFLPIVVYIIFVVGVLKIIPEVPADSVSGFHGLPAGFIYFTGIVGVLTLITSYLLIGSNVFDILRTDIFKSSFWAGTFVIFLPVIFFLVGFRNFFNVLGLAGGVFLAMESIIVHLMWYKIKRRGLLIKIIPVIVVFLVAIFYEFGAFLGYF